MGSEMCIRDRSKYVKIELEDINIAHEKRDGIDMLELNITLPDNKKEVTLQ